VVTGCKGGGYESRSHDRLVYVTICLIGHQVEVQVKNGSMHYGIFHATNTDNDFGIVLKMARLIKDAREIEGEETQDLHLAEERGLHFHENFDIDEETRFSSVTRGK
ncbi:hypothetical protein S83_007467, partial [Arachis hypogaea]